MENLLGEIKLEIIKNLKTFSELKTKYNINAIYRTGELEFFSEKSKKLNLEGVPKSRPSVRMVSNEDPKQYEDILEPYWYGTTLEYVIQYCNEMVPRNSSVSKRECESYKYMPYDKSLQKQKKLLFLDLTGNSHTGISIFYYDLYVHSYKLNIKLIDNICKYIIIKWKDDIFLVYKEKETDEEELIPLTDMYPESQLFSDDTIQAIMNDNYSMCIDRKCDGWYDLREILSGYGYNGGFRKSRYGIDRFFTLELFHLIKDLDLENELDFIFMGYYHHYIVNGDYDQNNTTKYKNSIMPSEFTIPYKCAINKNYISFEGKAAKGREIINKSSTKRKWGFGGNKKRNKSIKKTKKNKKHKKYLRLKN